MRRRNNGFISLLISVIVYVQLSSCKSIHEDKHAEHEEYDINSAPMPSLHDGPQQHTRWPQTTTEKVKQEQHHHFIHKIENSPLPSAHEGPQPLKMAKRSAPMALDNKFKDAKVENEENYREMASGEVSLNPQKPKNADENNVETTTIRDFAKDVYKHYGVSNNYGSDFKYNFQQPFSGYYSSSNIGVVPPKTVNAKDYYNSISNLAPILGQHGGVYSDLLEKNPQDLPAYGNSGMKFNSNAYHNVLTGLLMWKSMNDHNTFKYDVYNNQNITNELRAKTFYGNSLMKCEKNEEALCIAGNKAVCTNDKNVFCTSTKFKRCQNGNSTCVDDGNNSEEIVCLKNVMLTETQRLNDLNLKGETNKTLCAVTLMIPKI